MWWCKKPWLDPRLFNLLYKTLSSQSLWSCDPCFLNTHICGLLPWPVSTVVSSSSIPVFRWKDVLVLEFVSEGLEVVCIVYTLVGVRGPCDLDSDGAWSSLLCLRMSCLLSSLPVPANVNLLGLEGLPTKQRSSRIRGTTFHLCRRNHLEI